jgi:hypothetical protein
VVAWLTVGFNHRYYCIIGTIGTNPPPAHGSWLMAHRLGSSRPLVTVHASNIPLPLSLSPSPSLLRSPLLTFLSLSVLRQLPPAKPAMSETSDV